MLTWLHSGLLTYPNQKTEEGKEKQETEEFQGWRASFF
jgi:hypothetical protein